MDRVIEAREIVSDRPSSHGIFSMVPMEATIDHGLSHAAFRYLVFLIGVSFARNGVSWYSQEKAGRAIGLKRRRMIAIADELEASGWIERKRTNGSVTLTHVVKDRMTHLLTCAEKCTGPVQKSAQDLCNKVHSNKSKELDVMNKSKYADPPGEGDQKPFPRRTRMDPSILPDLADKAGEKAEQVRNKLTSKKRWDRKAEVQKAREKKRVSSWKGTKFYSYLMSLCAQHSVPLADMVELTGGVPPRYAKGMNDVLALLRTRQVSNETFATILEKMTAQWHTGASAMMSKDGRLSIYMIRSRIDEVLARFGTRRSSQVDDAHFASIPTYEDLIKKEKG